MKMVLDKMRFIYVFLLLIFSSCSINMDRVTVDSPEIGYEGRYFMTDSGSVRYDYPGFRIKTSFTGTKICAKFKPGSGYYIVEVDDLPEFKLSTETGDSLFVIADGLANGTHDVSITLVSEGIFSQPEFFGFEVDGSLLSKKPANKRKKVEFIGNSITCGYGVEAAAADEPFSDSTSNFLKSYAGLLARALDAEISVVARSGIGIHRNYNEPVNNHGETMPMVYDRAAISEKDSLWDFSFVPDLVCLNLGTNDLSTAGYDLNVLREEYSAFFSAVRGKYPNAVIVLLSGCMLGEKEAFVLSELQREIVENAKKSGDDKVHQFSFAPQDGSLGYGADWHPSERQQKKMADELLPFILDLNIWANN